MPKLPVLVLAFNRADHVEKAMEAIRQYQPERLYLECDGPRAGKNGEKQAVEDTRTMMLSKIDWPCDVKTLFREENWGCAKAVNDAITWFFSQEKWGVIIEDDIVVSQDFFRLCEDLLPRYEHEDRIMEISAQNHFPKEKNFDTYLYGQEFHCWGWASWARAWKKMDMKMTRWPEVTISFLIKKFGLFRGLMMEHYWSDTYAHIETSTSWATRWFFSIIINDGFCILPGNNLAINIGMDGGAHYDRGDKDPYSYLKLGNLRWPLRYDDDVKINPEVVRQSKADFKRVRMIGLKKKFRRLPQFRNPTNSLRSLRSKLPRMQFLLFKLAFCHILTDMSA